MTSDLKRRHKVKFGLLHSVLSEWVLSNTLSLARWWSWKKFSTLHELCVGASLCSRPMFQCLLTARRNERKVPFDISGKHLDVCKTLRRNVPSVAAGWWTLSSRLSAIPTLYAALKRGWRVLTCGVHLNSTLLLKCTILTVYKSESSLSHACRYCSKVQKCKSQVLLHPPPTPDRSAPRRSSFKLTSTNTVASGSAACTRRITKSHSSPVHVNETQAPLSSSKALLSADSYHFTSGLWAGHGRTRLQRGWRIINSLLSLSLGHTAHLFQTRARLLMPHLHKMTVLQAICGGLLLSNRWRPGARLNPTKCAAGSEDSLMNPN